MVFVCSMGDLFHESVPFESIYKVLQVIEKCPQHTFQLLTKRPEKVLEYCEWAVSYLNIKGLKYRFPNNVWLGVTAENQQTANERIPILLDIPAAKRFVSCEPLLSDIDIREWLHDSDCIIKGSDICTCNEPREVCIDWVISGPETGPKAREMDIKWLYNIRRQCASANVPFFDKKNTLGLNIQQIPQ